MKTASAGELSSSAGVETCYAQGTRAPERAHQECAPTREPGRLAVWMLAVASIGVIVFIYFFAFRAAHTAQIKDVPLAKREAKP